jgi:predicted DNA-binding transcriptional regulator AlpA
MRSPDMTQPDPLLSLADACAYVGLSRQWVRKLRAGERFPAPLMLGRLCKWRRSWLDAWLNAQPRGFGAL